MNRLERTILKNLIHNDTYSRKVFPFLDESYFSDNTEKILLKEIQEFVNKYRNLPTHEALIINITEKQNLTAQDVSDTVQLLNEIKMDKNESVDEQWLLDQTEKFCQDKSVYNAIMESVSILDDKSSTKGKGEIPKLLSDALAVSFNNNVGHDYLKDSESRYESYHKVESRVKTDLSLLNKITNGGFPVKSLCVFMAGTGAGKSMMMCHLSAAAIKNGHNVLYITMEMAEERIAERVDANLLNISVKDLHNIPKDDYLKRFERLKSKTDGKLIIKEYPTAGASTLHFRALLNDLKLKKGFVPDIIFVDYLNICASSRMKQGGSVNSYTYIKSIAEELRGLAVEFNVPIISATQTNRGGYGDSDVDITNVSESFGLAATVDFLAALITNEELEKLNQIMVKQLKNRYSDPNNYKRFVLGVDRSKMRFYDVEDGAQDNISDSGIPDTPLNKFGGRERGFNDKFNGLKV